MQFNNRNFGESTKPFLESPFTQYFQFPGNAFPPGTCFLGIAVTSGILALQVSSGFLSVHCISQIFSLVNYQGNNYTDYLGNRYIEIQPE